MRSVFAAAMILCAGLWMLPGCANAGITLEVSQTHGEHIQIDVHHGAPGPDCFAGGELAFNPQLGVAKVSATRYLQALNSEVSDEAVYLKAARMGGGVYMYLPYFKPEGTCRDVVFRFKAGTILWDGKWYAGTLDLPMAIVKDKAIFFTDETAPKITAAGYVDPAIPAAMRARLELSFAHIVETYTGVFAIDPMKGVGTVVAIVRNQGKYKGFGGDSLNIIRMSYDNPTPDHLLTLDRVFPSTFAHELAHKLQSEVLFRRTHGRYIVEGSADFLKVLVLHEAGQINEDQAKGVIRKAVADCTQYADGRSLADKLATRTMRFREPYDCGMVYYFVAYYSSALNGSAFVAALRKALAGQDYGAQQDSLCLLFETSCANARLNGIGGDRARYLEQSAWLEEQLANRPLPRLNGGF